MVVFTTTFANQLEREKLEYYLKSYSLSNLGEATIVLQILPHSFPQPLECPEEGKMMEKLQKSVNSRYRASEADRCQVLVCSDCLAKDWTVRGKEVDHTVRKASISEYLVYEVVGEDGGVAGLPQGDVALHGDNLAIEVYRY